jgi:hypothetical protein
MLLRVVDLRVDLTDNGRRFIPSAASYRKETKETKETKAEKLAKHLFGGHFT